MKRKTVAAAISTALLMGMLSSTIAMADSDNAKKSLVALGDSITFGYNLGVNNDHPSKEAFPYVIGKDENVRVRDLGEPGWTTSDLLNALETDKFKEALRHADAVTLDIGNNDLLHAISGLMAKMQADPSYSPTPQDLYQMQLQVGAAIQLIQLNLPTIISKIREETSAPIVLYTIYNPIPEHTALHGISEQILPSVNGFISLTAAQSKCLLADAYTAFSGKQMTLVRIAEGDIHPTVEGQKVLAKLAEDALLQSGFTVDKKQ